MPAYQIILTIFYVLCLLALLVLLFLIWISSERRLKHIQSMELTMFEIARKDAESAHQAVESCKALIALLSKDNHATDH